MAINRTWYYPRKYCAPNELTGAVHSGKTITSPDIARKTLEPWGAEEEETPTSPGGRSR